MNIRKCINIVEGNYIPHRKRTIAMDVDAYELYRVLQKLGGEYKEATEVGTDAIMTFYHPLDYKYYTDALKKYGIQYKDVNEEKDETSEEKSQSPVPNPNFRNIKYY